MRLAPLTANRDQRPPSGNKKGAAPRHGLVGSVRALTDAVGTIVGAPVLGMTRYSVVIDSNHVGGGEGAPWTGAYTAGINVSAEVMRSALEKVCLHREGRIGGSADGGELPISEYLCVHGGEAVGEGGGGEGGIHERLFTNVGDAGKIEAGKTSAPFESAYVHVGQGGGDIDGDE